MEIDGVLANVTVRDLERSLRWYGRLFGREPDARPMEGLAEWHLASGSGVQVWAEPDRAGRSTMVLRDRDLDARAEHLRSAGIPARPEPASASRIIRLEDPDGNRVVFTGA